MSLSSDFDVLGTINIKEPVPEFNPNELKFVVDSTGAKNNKVFLALGPLCSLTYDYSTYNVVDESYIIDWGDNTTTDVNAGYYIPFLNNSFIKIKDSLEGISHTYSDNESVHTITITTKTGYFDDIILNLTDDPETFVNGASVIEILTPIPAFRRNDPYSYRTFERQVETEYQGVITGTFIQEPQSFISKYLSSSSELSNQLSLQAISKYFFLFNSHITNIGVIDIDNLYVVPFFYANTNKSYNVDIRYCKNITTLNLFQENISGITTNFSFLTKLKKLGNAIFPKHITKGIIPSTVEELANTFFYNYTVDSDVLKGTNIIKIYSLGYYFNSVDELVSFLQYSPNLEVFKNSLVFSSKSMVDGNISLGNIFINNPKLKDISGRVESNRLGIGAYSITLEEDFLSSNPLIEYIESFSPFGHQSSENYLIIKCSFDRTRLPNLKSMKEFFGINSYINENTFFNPTCFQNMTTKDITEMFYYTEGTSFIPSNCFKDSDIETAKYCFYRCDVIAESIFNNCKLKDASYMFNYGTCSSNKCFLNCTSLENISNMFSYGTLSAENIFEGCTGIKVASDVFGYGNCTVNIDNLLQDCINLENVSDFFMRSKINFAINFNTFFPSSHKISNCRSFTQYSNNLKGDASIIYSSIKDRSTATSISSSYCCSGTSLSNRDLVPTNWGGTGN